MLKSINLCTSTMPNFGLIECLKATKESGYQGIELRVHDKYHVSLNQLYHHSNEISNIVENHGLELSVYNTYYGINDKSAIDTLFRTCRRTGVKFFRVVLPIAGQAAVSEQALEGAIIPSYIDNGDPATILITIRKRLLELEKQALQAGVTVLLEIHWGTVMSCFSNAFHLICDLDPRAIAITFDPANMIIEGKEDWEYGINLIQKHMANLHIKNVSWDSNSCGWQWRWSGLNEGMVPWDDIYSLLKKINYQGIAAMEDFCVPANYQEAVRHLSNLRQQTLTLNKNLEKYSVISAA